MPKLTEKLGKFITDVGAIGDRLIQGEGDSKKKRVRKPRAVKKAKSLDAPLDESPNVGIPT
eukprot:42069-Eustigmatos_ZCMA.PRE.1